MGLPARIARPTVARMGRVREGDDPKYLTAIRQLPSCVSGKRPCEAHHLLHVDGPKGVGRKNEDRYAVPLTADEHRLVHSKGDDEAALMELGVDARALTSALWAAYRKGGVEAMERISFKFLQKIGKAS